MFKNKFVQSILISVSMIIITMCLYILFILVTLFVDHFIKYFIFNFIFPCSSIVPTIIYTNRNRNIISPYSIVIAIIIYLAVYFVIYIRVNGINAIIIVFTLFTFVICFLTIKYTNLICYINQNLGKLYEYRFKSKIKNFALILGLIIMFLLYIAFIVYFYYYALIALIQYVLYLLPLYLFPVLLKLFYREIKISEPLEFLGDENPAAV